MIAATTRGRLALIGMHVTLATYAALVLTGPSAADALADAVAKRFTNNQAAECAARPAVFKDPA